MSLIECQDVAFSYEGKTVISDLNFRVEQGDYLCVVGENGSGKSTLIKGILRLKTPSTGKLTFGDDLHLNEIGYLPQQTNVQKDFPASVWEVVLSGCLNSLGHKLFFSAKEKQLAQKKMEELHLMKLQDACYRDLSGGQQQRVLLARALCASQKLLVLDEPVTGLDPIVTMEFYHLVREINKTQKISIIMVTHDIKEAVEQADLILHLHNKQLYFGSVENYLATPLGKFFSGGGLDDCDLRRNV